MIQKYYGVSDSLQAILLGCFVSKEAARNEAKCRGKLGTDILTVHTEQELMLIVQRRNNASMRKVLT